MPSSLFRDELPLPATLTFQDFIFQILNCLIGCSKTCVKPNITMLLSISALFYNWCEDDTWGSFRHQKCPLPFLQVFHTFKNKGGAVH